MNHPIMKLDASKDIFHTPCVQLCARCLMVNCAARRALGGKCPGPSTWNDRK